MLMTVFLFIKNKIKNTISCHFFPKKLYILEWHELIKNAILMMLCKHKNGDIGIYTPLDR